MRHLLPLLWEKSGGICALCDKALEPIAAKVHIDHIVPRAAGGTNEVDNLQAVHKSCNSRKGNRPMAEVVERIRTTPPAHRSRPRSGKTTVIFTLSSELLDRVEDFQFNNRYANRSAALKALIRTGLDLYRDEP